jgi:hypothetical protein
MANLRNLALRPAKPALNRGRVQRLARRALIVLGIASTSEVMEWTCCRKRLHGRRIECHDYRAALFVTVGGSRRAVRFIARLVALAVISHGYY